MSKVAITGNASGTGVFTVASPNSNVDRVLTLPDEGGTVDTLQRSGNVVQVVNFQTGALATGTTVIPLDNTIPQITEGFEVMTLAITPTNASNILMVDVATFIGTPTDNAWLITALFVGTTADALATMPQYAETSNPVASVFFRHRMVAGATTELTFRVRCGQNTAGTLSFNGHAGIGFFNGTSASSITITEYTA